MPVEDDTVSLQRFLIYIFLIFQFEELEPFQAQTKEMHTHQGTRHSYMQKSLSIDTSKCFDIPTCASATV